MRIASIHGTATTLTADKVVGLILWTKKPVTLHRAAFPDSEVLETYPAGSSIGKVNSWVNPNPVIGRKNLWWEFQYSDGTYYYVEHLPDRFDWAKLESQLPPQPEAENTLPGWMPIAGLLFTGFQAATAKSPLTRFAWGISAAGIGGYWIWNKLKTVDFNPFD